MSLHTARIITELRKEKGWNQGELSEHSGMSREIIGKYERNEAVPSLEAAKKIADALEISLDYLVGEGLNSKFDKKKMKRFQEIELLEEEKKKMLYDLIDTYIRDAKARKVYGGK
jgi:transcriptional regulator with XRE-family HTH domain